MKPRPHRFLLPLIGFLLLPALSIAEGGDLPALYDLNSGLKSRSITRENMTGAPGEGGREASELGIGRKGAPNYTMAPGETFELCNIEGSGTIRHIWMTGHWFNFYWKNETGREDMLRRLVIRAYWEGQEHPSIESPLGDFMGVAHSKTTFYESVAHSTASKNSLNFWLPMPFTERARIVLTNESDKDVTVFYQIDYTTGDVHPADVGRMHTVFQRQNPTTMKQDFELLPKRTGKGRFLGTVIGVRTLHPGWWGEGEVKVFMDGDDEFPTIVGTGTEDYVGISYGMEADTRLYHGCSLKFRSSKQAEAMNLKFNKLQMHNTEFLSMYRWHVKDPIYWEKECRITVQQIGCCLYEREDDWSAASFWYEPIPSAPLPPFPSLEERVANLEELHEIETPAAEGMENLR